MPLYFAVCDDGDGLLTMSAPAASRFKLFNMSRLVKTSQANILAFYNTQTQIRLFPDEQSALDHAIKKSSYTDSAGTYAAHPLLQVKYAEIISGATIVAKNKVTLLKGKMLHVGNKKILTLPYQDLDKKVSAANVTSQNPARKLTEGFDLRIAIPLFAIIFLLTNELNKRTINKENFSMAVMAATLATFLYAKYSLHIANDDKEMEINAEIDYRTNRSMRLA
jgi:hypothetical protein